MVDLGLQGLYLTLFGRVDLRYEILTHLLTKVLTTLHLIQYGLHFLLLVALHMQCLILRVLVILAHVRGSVSYLVPLFQFLVTLRFILLQQDLVLVLTLIKHILTKWHM
jgi:hypothetical protein